jgi:hypothetical protein
VTELPSRPTRLDPIVLATAATSADPWRARLVALAAVRPRAGQPATLYETCFNPRARVPGFVCQAVGLSQLDFEESATFADQVEALLEFIGSAPLAGVEVLTQVERLDHELARLQRPGLRNPLVDLAQLAERLGLVAGKPHLPALAAALGLTHHHPYRPSADARVAARLTQRLLRLAEERGLTAAETLYQPPLAGPGALRRPDPAPAPDGPGVYLLLDADGQVLYVGQARNLRRRLAAYHRQQLALLRRLEGLAEAVAEVHTIPTTSDLEAQVLEARLIGQHRPRYNTQRRVRLPSLFLRADLGPTSAGLTACQRPLDDRARYIGPFRTTGGARQALGLLRRLFPPLTGRARRGAATRQPLVAAALRFLDGQRQEVLDRLQAEQRLLAARGDQTAVRRSQLLLRQAVAFQLDLASDEAVASPDRMLVLTWRGRGSILAHVLSCGRLAGCYESTSLREARQRARTLPLAPEPAEPSAVSDEVALVTRWLYRLGPEHRLERLPER